MDFSDVGCVLVIEGADCIFKSSTKKTGELHSSVYPAAVRVAIFRRLIDETHAQRHFFSFRKFNFTKRATKYIVRSTTRNEE